MTVDESYITEGVGELAIWIIKPLDYLVSEGNVRWNASLSYDLVDNGIESNI